MFVSIEKPKLFDNFQQCALESLPIQYKVMKRLAIINSITKLDEMKINRKFKSNSAIQSVCVCVCVKLERANAFGNCITQNIFYFSINCINRCHL